MEDEEDFVENVDENSASLNDKMDTPENNDFEMEADQVGVDVDIDETDEVAMEMTEGVNVSEKEAAVEDKEGGKALLEEYDDIDLLLEDDSDDEANPEPPQENKMLKLDEIIDCKS